MTDTPISWEEITSAIRALSLPSFDAVIGIARGGIIPAALVAHKLGCALMTARLQYRDDSNTPLHSEPVIADKPSIEPGKHLLIVDDVSVSGSTLAAAKALFTDCDVTTLVCKGKGADYVLFPEIEGCVVWPWHMRS